MLGFPAQKYFSTKLLNVRWPCWVRGLIKKKIILFKKKDICGCALALNTFLLGCELIFKLKISAKEAYLEFFNKIKKQQKKKAAEVPDAPVLNVQESDDKTLRCSRSSGMFQRKC